MKKGQVYEATVERVDFPCKGIARTQEGPVTVKNCLPGQKISLSVSKVRNGKAEGRLLGVMEKSPLETASPCSHFGVCGGCAYLSLPYEEQLRVKEGQVKRLLDACLERQESEWQWEGIKASPVAYGYRNKMEFSFGDEEKDGPLSLGMHKRGSFYDVVTVEDCRIVDRDFRLILKTALEYFAGYPAPRRVTYFHRMRHEGYLRHLLVRKASRTGEILVALVTTSQSPWGDCVVPEKAVTGNCERAADRVESGTAADAGRYGVPEGRGRIAAQAGSVADEAVAGAPEEAGAMPLQKGAGGEGCEEAERQLIEGFQERLRDLERNGGLEGRFAGILHIVNDSQADVVRSDRTDILYGQDYFYEELLGLRFKVSVFSFFQTNSYGAEVLYETARSYVGELGSGAPEGKPDKVVYDLYSGTGTIAQLMAPAAGRVIGVEIVEEAVQAARKNAEMNGLTNCEFIAGDVLKVLDRIPERPDYIILDPPRDGIHPKALGKIISYGVERILYISCKPTSLVRDLAVFLERGYQVERAVAVDQFPWTGNIETVCLLSNRKSKPDTHVKLSLSMDDYYRIKEEGKNNQ